MPYKDPEKERESARKRQRKYRNSNREKCRKATRAWAAANKKAVGDSYKIWARQNRGKRNEINARWLKANKDIRNLRRRDARIKNPEKVRMQDSRKFLNPNARLVASMRTRISKALKESGVKKDQRTFSFIGCAVSELKQHLEKQFQPGMTWENYGFYGWHVDHIKPCASFDLTNPEQQKVCFHFSNLQPLWAADNIRKGDTYGG